MGSRSGKYRTRREDSIRQLAFSGVSAPSPLEWRRYHVIHRDPCALPYGNVDGRSTPEGP